MKTEVYNQVLRLINGGGLNFFFQLFSRYGWRFRLEAMEEASSLFRKGLIYKIMVSLYRQYSDTICCI